MRWRSNHEITLSSHFPARMSNSTCNHGNKLEFYAEVSVICAAETHTANRTMLLTKNIFCREKGTKLKYFQSFLLYVWNDIKLSMYYCCSVTLRSYKTVCAIYSTEFIFVTCLLSCKKCFNSPQSELFRAWF